MKRLIIWFAIIIIAIGGIIITARNAESQPGTIEIVLPDDNLMLVLYLKADDQFLQAIRGPATFGVSDNKMYLEDKVVVNDMTKVGYSIHPWQRIEPKYEYDPELDEDIEVSQYMSELNLAEITADDLPRSQHIAVLSEINPARVKPATVIRKYLGETYEVRCLVSQTAKELYLAGKLNIGDYVIVSFITEVPGSQEYNIAIVVDKVWESW